MYIYEGVVYLDLDDALVVYADVVECPLESARDQLRSVNGLESALARPGMYRRHSSQCLQDTKGMLS